MINKEIEKDNVPGEVEKKRKEVRIRRDND